MMASVMHVKKLQYRENFDRKETRTMTEPKIAVTEDELHAYIDNELPAERRGDVEAWLTTHPDDAAAGAGVARDGGSAACAL